MPNATAPASASRLPEPTVSRRALVAGGAFLGLIASGVPAGATSEPVDATLLHAADALLRSISGLHEASRRQDEAEARYSECRPPLPSALFWKSSDIELGMGHPGCQPRNGPAHYLPADRKWLEASDGLPTKTVGERARRDEVLSALAAHEAAEVAAAAAARLPEADAAFLAAVDEVDVHADALAEIPARTVEGALMKARAAAAASGGRAPTGDGAIADLWASIVLDLANIGADLAERPT